MGVKIRPILQFEDKKSNVKLDLIQKISFSDIKGYTVTVDAANAIYQFLSSIIQASTGMPLVDSNDRITSHLSGLFYRTIRLIEKGIKPIYVFDGKPPKLKAKTIKERREVREEAHEKWETAIQEGDMEAARKYGQAAHRMTSDIVEESKSLLKAMGIPVIQAVTEGEAQAAYMVGKNNIDAVASQDFDALLFGAPEIIRNLSLAERRKAPGKNEYIQIEPEKIILSNVLDTLKITRKQLIELSILVGTDFNEGIKGVGAKTALKLIQTYNDLQSVIKEKSYEFNRTEDEIEEIKEFFLYPQVIDEYNTEFGKPKKELIKKILVDEHQFSLERVEKHIDRLLKLDAKKQQRSLDKWF